jgi:REP element-mobilizing transposase RayT
VTTTKKTRAIGPVQLLLLRHGGKRDGAGRKPQGEFVRTAHARRSKLTRRDPVLVTTHLVDGRPSLRNERTLATLRRVLSAGSDRFGFRLVEFGIQTNHLHLLAEADDERALSRGLQGLLVRVAKALNAEWGAKGRVLRDRYGARILQSPRDVRFALIYVLQNARKHGAMLLGVDHFSSGPWFEGWSDRIAKAGRPIAKASSWLLTVGWSKHWGKISTTDAPVGGRDVSWHALLDLDRD